jgi:hypothetical protein
MDLILTRQKKQENYASIYESHGNLTKTRIDAGGLFGLNVWRKRFNPWLCGTRRTKKFRGRRLKTKSVRFPSPVQPVQD